MEKLKVFIHLDREIFGEDVPNDKLISISSNMKVRELHAQIYKEHKKMLRSKNIFEEDLASRRKDNGIYLYELFSFPEAKVQEGSSIVITKIPNSPCKLSTDGVFTSIYSTPVGIQQKQVKKSCLENNINKKVDYPSQIHRTRLEFFPGLNIECECVNKDCVWKNVKQLVYFRFGKQDLADLLASSRCRKCSREFDHDKTKRIAFCNCRYRYEFIDEICDLYKSEWIKVSKPEEISWESFFSEKNRLFRKVTFYVLKEENRFRFSSIE